MPVYEVTFVAQVLKRVTVAARDEDDAFEIADEIVRGETVDSRDLDWEGIEVGIGSEDDLEV